jgi:hypothetical protein
MGNRTRFVIGPGCADGICAATGASTDDDAKSSSGQIRRSPGFNESIAVFTGNR